MWYRIKQLLTTIYNRRQPLDRTLVEQHLSPVELLLFLTMDRVDRQHVLAVTSTALHQASSRPEVNRHLLARCCLLHDLGKAGYGLRLWQRVLPVVLENRLLAGLAHRLAEYQEIFLAQYVYGYHASAGARIIENLLGDQALAEIIRQHHRQPFADDPPELVLLRQADRIN